MRLCAVCTPRALAAAGQVAKMLLIRGLATAARHRSDDERSAHYEELLEAEQVQCTAAAVCSHLGCCAGKHGHGHLVLHACSVWAMRASEDPVMQCGHPVHVRAAVHQLRQSWRLRSS